MIFITMIVIAMTLSIRMLILPKHSAPFGGGGGGVWTGQGV